MKKLMTLAVITATALVSQAATIGWLNIAIKNPIAGDSYGDANAGTILWLFKVDSTFGSGSLDGLFDPVAGALVGGTELTVDAGSITFNAGTGKAGFEYSVDQSVISGYYAVVAWDPNSPDNYGVHTFFAPFIANTADTWNVVANGFPNSLTIGPATGVVPEPLTVGLALAGVALLIAQRKRK